MPIPTPETSHMTQPEASTAPTPAKPSRAGNWLMDFGNLSPSDVQALEAMRARDKAVGELLRAQHYLGTSRVPSRMVPGQTEDDYWTGLAKMSPGYSVEELQTELDRRIREKNASSTAAKVL